mmetsp:Transcript_5935/g.21183  ORF Transcript_5935/g.21183 Transcript_5935/m.21183 type:complete len:315 (-) Transcript_5935:277-1221(-)
MYSMKRTSTGFVRVISTKSPTSSSLTPFITTTFTLTDGMPSATASSIDFSTRSKPCRRVSAANFLASSVSRLMLSPVTPAARSRGSRRDSTRPLVVMPSPCRPGSAASCAQMSMASRRTSGSPPVSRILVTPACTNSAARRTISSLVSRCDASDSVTPSAGMQYRHRRLHRSVSEMRRYVCSRPKESVSGFAARTVGSIASSRAAISRCASVVDDGADDAPSAAARNVASGAAPSSARRPLSASSRDDAKERTTWARAAATTAGWPRDRHGAAAAAGADRAVAAAAATGRRVAAAAASTARTPAPLGMSPPSSS